MTPTALEVSTAPPLQMEQAKLGTTTSFQFGEDSLKYVVRDKSGSGTVNVQFQHLGVDHDLLVERNTWLLNTKLRTEAGTVLIIQDGQHDSIMAEIEKRRLDQLRRWYDFLDQEQEPQRQLARFRWLHEQGALSAEELAEREQRVNALSSLAPAALPDEGSRPRLN